MASLLTSRRSRQNPKTHPDRDRALLFFAGNARTLHTYIAAGNNPDQPGRFIQWLYTRQPVQDLSDQGHVVRHREQGNARGSEPNLREIREVAPNVGAAFVPRTRGGAFAHRGIKALPHLFQPAFVELDEVEISADVFPACRRRTSFRKCRKRALLRRGIGPHARSSPDSIARSLPAYASHRFLRTQCENRRVVFAFVRRFLEGVRIDLQKRQQMFVESDRLVIVAVEQTAAMQARLVDQSRQMDVTAQPLVGTPRKQSLPLTAS